MLFRSKAANQAFPHTIYLSVSAYGSPHKEWPLDKWAEATRFVWEVRPEIMFLVGYASGEREAQRARQLAGLVTNPQKFKLLDTSPSLAEIAVILKRAELFAGLDSGLLHLAVALGKPTVSVFRDYVGKLEWAPAGAKHRVLSCFCHCHQTQRDDCGTTPRCLAEVSAKEVASAMLELLPNQNS